MYERSTREQTEITGHDLHPAESEKLARISAVLVAAFARVGCHDVCDYRAKGEGEKRIITFHRRGNDQSVISFTSMAFLASTSTDLSRTIESHLAR
jgi:hypothetical protein